MSYQQQTMLERFGAPPQMKEKARLRLCDKCNEKGQQVYLYWGDTGVPKKNEPDKTIVLPVEHKTGQWHECPYREPYNGNSGAQKPPQTQSYTMQPQPQYQRPNIPQPDSTNLQGYLQSMVDQNKQIMQYNQSLVAALNHAVEYLEIIADNAKRKPQRISIQTPGTERPREIGNTIQPSPDTGEGVNEYDEGQEFDKVNSGDFESPRTFDTEKESKGKRISLQDGKDLNQETDAAIEKEYQEYKAKY